jgi:hypothetical protein
MADWLNRWVLLADRPRRLVQIVADRMEPRRQQLIESPQRIHVAAGVEINGSAVTCSGLRCQRSHQLPEIICLRLARRCQARATEIQFSVAVLIHRMLAGLRSR